MSDVSRELLEDEERAVVLHDAMRALVDMLLVAMLIKGVSLDRTYGRAYLAYHATWSLNQGDRIDEPITLIILYQSILEFIEDTKDESSDSDTEGEGLEDEGPGSNDEGPGSEDKSLGSEEEKAAPEVVPTQVASPVTTPTTTIAVGKDELLEVGAQLELHESILHDHTQRLDALPLALFEGYDMDFRESYTRSWAVRDEIFSQRYRLKSLEQERKGAIVTFSAIWRPMLALESWAGHVDAKREEMWRARYDDHRRGAIESSRLHEAE
nr:hypothetical protein [Tanacetum cinerariifolium]